MVGSLLDRAGSDSYTQLVIMFIGVNIIMSSSLNLINGYMGEFSCGHAGFMAVGAYVSSLLTVWFFTTGSVFGPALLDLPLGDPPLSPAAPDRRSGRRPGRAHGGHPLLSDPGRLSGHHHPGRQLHRQKRHRKHPDHRRGPGLHGHDPGGQWDGSGREIPWMLIWTGIFVTLTVVVIQRFVSSTYGKGMIAIREDEIAAEIMGIHTRRIKMIAFMLSSGLAGVAGGLLAHILGYINPGSFTIMKSTEAMVMVYLGGMGSLSGSVLSAVLFTLLLEVLRPLEVFKWVVVPLLLFLLMLFRPEGLLGHRELTDVFPGLKRIFRSEGK